MFDITSSKLLLLAIVVLLVIGPKDFPLLLRTIGKYIGIIRGHAKEFRAQFDEAIRESELSELKKDVESFAQETEASLSATKQSVEQTIDEARHGADASVATTPAPAADPLAHDTGGVPQPAQVAESGPDGAASPASDAPPAEQSPAAAEAVPTPATEKTGA